MRDVIVAFYAVLIFAITGCQSSENPTSAVSGNPVNGQLPLTGDAPTIDNLSPPLVEGQSDNSGRTPDRSSDFALDKDYRHLLTSIAGESLEQLAIDIVLIGDTLPSSAINSTVLDGGTYSIEDQNQNINLPASRRLFTCELGGGLTLEAAELTINEPFYSRDSLFTHYAFDQCRLAGQGEQVLDGSLQTVVTNITGRHFTSHQKQHTLTAFSWVQGAGLAIEADAALSFDEFSSFSVDQSRQVVINNYTKHNGDALIQRIGNASFSQTSNLSANGVEQEYSINAQGSITGQAGIAVNVTTDPIFYSRQSNGALAIESTPFSGQLTMSADDRSQLVLTATQAGNAADLYVSVAYRDANGLTSSLNALRLIDLLFVAP